MRQTASASPKSQPPEAGVAPATVRLRLFHRDAPDREVEVRELAEGELSIGRDAGADWRLEDPARAISRAHCVLSLKGGRLSIRDTSSNGVFLGEDRRRPAHDHAVPLRLGEAVRLGPYLLVAERDAAAPAPVATLASPTAPAGRSRAPDAAVAPTRPSAGSALLAAFCEGARLDPSTLASEDPEEVMRRLGAVYHEMVGGLGGLLGERSALKADYRMTQTTVGAAGNNLLKWASPQRTAVDLLRGRDDGFLNGPAAVGEAFCDLKAHLVGVVAGLRAALATALDALAPERVEAQVRAQPNMMRNRTALAWAEYARLHGELRRQLDGDDDGEVERAFRAAYARGLAAEPGHTP